MCNFFPPNWTRCPAFEPPKSVDCYVTDFRSSRAPPKSEVGPPGHLPSALSDLFFPEFQWRLERQEFIVVGKYYPPFEGGIESYTRRHQRGAGKIPRCDSSRLQPHRRRRDRGRQWGRRSPVPPEWVFKGQPIALRLLRDLDPGRFDLVHFHAPNFFASAILLSKLMVGKRRVPVVITHHMEVHGRRILRSLVMPIYQALAMRSDTVIVTSPKNGDRSLDLPKAARKTAIPMGISVEEFRVTDVERNRAMVWRRSLVGDAPTIGFVGRHVRYKGLDVLLEALARLPGVHALIGGGGPLLPSLKEMAAQLGVADRAHFVGHLTTAEKKRLLAASDVFAFPSTEVTEAFGIAQLEAMAAGVPVCRERSADGRHGCFDRRQNGTSGAPGGCGCFCELPRTDFERSRPRRAFGHRGPQARHGTLHEAHRRRRNLQRHRTRADQRPSGSGPGSGAEQARRGIGVTRRFLSRELSRPVAVRPGADHQLGTKRLNWPSAIFAKRDSSASACASLVIGVCQPHEGAVSAVLQGRVHEDVPFGGVFFGEHAAALLKPVIDHHAVEAPANDHAIDPKLLPIRPGRPKGNDLRVFDLPAAGGKAIVRGVNGGAFALGNCSRRRRGRPASNRPRPANWRLA